MFQDVVQLGFRVGRLNFGQQLLCVESLFQRIALPTGRAAVISACCCGQAVNQGVVMGYH